MAQLTWRNIDAPDLSTAISALSQSSNNLQRAFAGAGQAFTDYGVRRQGENTGNIELALSKYGSNADLQTAIQQGILDPNALRSQYGNFDASAVAQYQNKLATDLQGREVAQQGIDKTNNLNQFGGQLSQTLIDARNGVPGASERLQQLQDSGLLGGVAADFAPQIATMSGQAKQDAETSRNNLANNAIGRTNAGANVMNAQTSRLDTNSAIQQRDRQWNAGELGRQVSDMNNQGTLDTPTNIAKGAGLFNPQSNDTPDVQRSKLQRQLIDNKTDPTDRDEILAGFDNNAKAFLNPQNTDVAKAGAATAPAASELSNLTSGAKSLISNAAARVDPWNNVWSAAEQSGVKTIPDAMAQLKQLGMDTTDRKLNGIIQDAVTAGASPAEVVAIAGGAGRGSYTSIVDGKTTLDESAFKDGLKQYMQSKNSTTGIEQRKRVTDENAKVDAMSAPVQKLLQQQQWQIARGRPDLAAALQPQINQGTQAIRDYLGTSAAAPVQSQPANPQSMAGWQPSWGSIR